MLFKNTYIIIFIFVIIFSTIFLIVLNKKAMPVIMSYASVQTEKIGIEVLRSTGINELNELLENNNLFEMIKNNNGEIESIDFNASIINDALQIIAKNVRKRLKEVEKGKNLPDEIYESVMDKKLKNGIIYEVPVGVVFGNSIFSNIGPKIPVKIKYSGNVGLDVKTRVSEYGINSALIEVYVLVEVTQKTILPFQSKDVKIKSEIPIVIKVVKGSVPYYLQGISETYSLPMN